MEGGATQIGKTYRIDRATLVLHWLGGFRTPTIIPGGGLVTLITAPLDGAQMVDVHWDGGVVMMFTGDFLERGTLVSPLVGAA